VYFVFPFSPFIIDLHFENLCIVFLCKNKIFSCWFFASRAVMFPDQNAKDICVFQNIMEGDYNVVISRRSYNFWCCYSVGRPIFDQNFKKRVKNFYNLKLIFFKIFIWKLYFIRRNFCHLTGTSKWVCTVFNIS
jgi:hypothetical protein